ncbi:hypothetical protein DL764_002114 [Monosporascus ibericus]|uniref:Uncharacterized protein n=1 Tax=Monosporascus ibericus TaxID=155417 RepID=A0A4Q4TP75_9PEZI|nr:hypothetical protein DL764_002114 [Monosporascus ibericus]
MPRRTGTWDSSDPDRAPPPLPLNPQSPSVSPSRSGTSLAIQSAHQALAEKARENEAAALVPALKKRSTTGDATPERALAPRPNSHKRMQSLQPGTVRDLSLMIEAAQDHQTPPPRGSSPEKFSRPVTPLRGREPERQFKPADKENANPNPPTPPPMSISLNPAVRPSMTRRNQHSILGENAPPQSATMLALQNMGPAPSREEERPAPLSTVTNNSNAVGKGSSTWDYLSGQIISLTNIATALQKEMAQLSRRSRDNATDLMSLKEATHARDEDIRKSLRDLVANIDNVRTHRDPNRDAYSGGLYIENKAHSTSPVSKPKPFSLPRIPSPNSFSASIDRESTISTPSLASSESPAVIALLEKIIREMGTRDGQDTVISQLSEVAEKLVGMASSAKVEELISYLKETNHIQAMVPAGGGRGGGGCGGTTRPKHVCFEDEDSERAPPELDWSERSGQMTLAAKGGHPPARATELINEDVMKVIRSVKDSVAQGGGMTAEVKALVRELRGEVLGMGRDIARKLDEVDADAHDKDESAGKQEVARIVEEGLDQMKHHMNELLREHRRASAASMKSAIDYQEIYNAIRTALSDSKADESGEPELTRDDVILAVKDAWENYKPEIQVEQIGLERDEVLSCLKEGLQEYAPSQEPSQGVTREEVYQAIMEGLQHFQPPQVESPTTLSRDEVLEAVRECLEEFEFPVAASGLSNDLTRDDVVDAVQQGLKSFDFPDNSATVVPHTDNSEVMARLHEIMRLMQQEFKAMSEEAKQNAAATARDTEQALDATRDGLDQLRAHIESYVDRLAENDAQEEHLENLTKSFESFRGELSELVARASDGSKEMLKEELESLRDAVNSSLVPHVPPVPDNRDALESIRDGIERIRHELLRPHAGTTDILDALHEGFSDLRTLLEKIGDKPVDLTANDEILDALNTGLGNVRTEIDALREKNSDNEKAVAPLGVVQSDALVPTDMLKQDDIKNLEVMMGQLRVKIEAIEAPQPGPAASEGSAKVDLSEIEEMFRDLQEKVAGISNGDVEESLRNLQASVAAISNEGVEESIRNLQASLEAISNVEIIEAIGKLEENVADLAAIKRKANSAPINLEDAATKEDVQAIETILRNTKGRMEDILDGEQSVRKDHIDAVQALVLETKDSIGSVVDQLEKVSRKEDLVAIESLVTQVNIAFDEMKERSEKALEDPEKVVKSHVEAVEAAVLEIKTIIQESVKSDIAALASKDDVSALPSKDDIAALPSKNDIAALPCKDDIAALPSKDDVKAVEEIVKELKENATAQAEASGQALVERRAEIVGVGERVGEVKMFLEQLQCLMQEKLEAGASGVDAIGRLLGNLSSTMAPNANVGRDVKELLEVMKNEFEEAKGSVAGAKLDTDEKFQLTTETLSAKIDEKVGELVAKYDALEKVMQERAAAGETHDADMEAAVAGTKAIGEELKVLVDTLGSTVTDSLEKMEEASKTVFGQVEQLCGKSEEHHADEKSQHQATRDQIQQAVGIVEGLQGRVAEFQPQVLESIKNVLEIVGQHFELSKSSVTDIQKTIEEAKPELPALPPPPEKYDDAEVIARLDKLAEDKYNDAEVISRLDKLAEDKYSDAEVLARLDKLAADRYSDAEVLAKLDKLAEEKYNDAEVQAKLDKLAEDKYSNAEVLARLDKLAEDKYNDAEVVTKLDKIIENKYDDSEVQVKLYEIAEKCDPAEVHSKLDKIIESDDREAVHTKLDTLVTVAEKTDPGEIHTKLDMILLSSDKEELNTKLDKLVDHTGVADKAYEQLSTLDKVHKQVMQTAAEISDFLSSQKKRNIEEQEAHEKSLRVTTIALERQKAERAEVETNLIHLRDEEAQLRESVQALRGEQQSLLRQKVRMAADISSLETALRIRREELHAMDARAEGLERRILEGVLDHSRALLMTKSGAKGAREAMSRKRVPGARSSLSSSPADTAATPTKRSSAAVNMAVAGNRASLTPKQAGASNRRILSLSQINSNLPAGGVTRSQSVRTPGTGAGALRKSSWAPTGGRAAKGYEDLETNGEKENSGANVVANEVVRESEDEDHDHGITPEPESPLDEEEEEGATEVMGDGDHGADENEAGDAASEAGTLRRSSLESTFEGGDTDYDDHSDYAEGAPGADNIVTENLADSESIAGDVPVMISAA